MGGGSVTLVGMAELWPDPVPGAPYTSRSCAGLALGAAARRVSDFARSMVPTGPPCRPDEPDRAGLAGVVLADALRLAELAASVVDAAVVLEREDGTGWAEITATAAARVHPAQEEDRDAQRLMRRRWDAVLRGWRRDLDFAALPGVAEQDELPAAIAAPEIVAAELDRWVVRHHESLDPDISATPVTDGLSQMDPLRELLHLAAVRRLLVEVYPVPPADLLGALEQRMALLDAAVAADVPAPR